MSPNIVLGLVIRIFGLWVISHGAYDFFYALVDAGGYTPEVHMSPQSLYLFAGFYVAAGLLTVKCADKISAFAYKFGSQPSKCEEIIAVKTDSSLSSEKAKAGFKITWNSRSVSICGSIALWLGIFSFGFEHIVRYVNTGSLSPTNINIALEAGITAQMIAGLLALCIARALKNLEDRPTQIV